jgi:threonine aldolase
MSGDVKLTSTPSSAVVFFNKALAIDFEYRCKQAGQLASKMRFLTAPWISMLESGTWLRNAIRANSRARQLASRLEAADGLEILFPVEANAVFLQASASTFEALRARGWRFYTFIGGGARFMFSWDSCPNRVDELAKDILRLA